MKFVLTILFATLLPAQAEWSPSENDEAIEGVIKVIYMDEENNRVRVRIKSSDEESAIEEFTVCDVSGNDNKDLNLIRQAFAHGTMVRVALSGSFNKCLSKVQYVNSKGELQQVGI